MINTNQTKPNMRNRRNRRGVGAIIGGVILVGILVTTVFGYFVTILVNEKARTSYEIQSQQGSNDKAAEEYIVQRSTTISSGSIPILVNNTGSIPMVASHALVYCSSGGGCTNPGKPIQDLVVTKVLNPGDYLSTTVGAGAMASGNTYTISVVSERGNIISSTICTVVGGSTCSQDTSGGDPAFDDIAQGTGVIQLDFKSYAAIFPDFKIRDGIDQTGKVTQSSNVKGYPAKTLYSDVNTILVQRLRNLDSSGQDIRILKNTAMLAEFGGTPGNNPPPIYICKTTGDPITIPPTAYVDSTGILLTNVPAPYDPAVGWQTIYFCINDNPSGSIDAWKPGVTFVAGINPVFMLLHAKYANSQVDYSQTIPYQGFKLNKANVLSSMVTCIYKSTSDVNTSCEAQTSVMSGSTSRYGYHGAAGSQFYIHVNSGGSPVGPYYVEWLNHDGTSQCLTPIVAGACSTSAGNGNRNILVTIPAGTPNGSYTIKVTDSSNVAGNVQATTFMTFQVP